MPTLATHFFKQRVKYVKLDAAAKQGWRFGKVWPTYGMEKKVALAGIELFISDQVSVPSSDHGYSERCVKTPNLIFRFVPLLGIVTWSGTHLITHPNLEIFN